MCTELIHRCKYCSKDYLCRFNDIQCPTINYDKDKNMCEDCRTDLERAIKILDVRRVREIIGDK